MGPSVLWGLNPHSRQTCLTCLEHETSPSHSFSSANRNCEKESPRNRKKIQLYAKFKENLSVSNLHSHSVSTISADLTFPDSGIQLCQGLTPQLLNTSVHGGHVKTQLATALTVHWGNKSTVRPADVVTYPHPADFSLLFNVCKAT